MDFKELSQSLQVSVGSFLPTMLAALAILLIGWLIALAVRATMRRLLGALRLNTQIASRTGRSMDFEGGVAKGAYYLVMLMAFLACFNALELPFVSEPLQALASKILDFLPQLLGAAALLLVAWVLATVLRTVTRGALGATGLDKRLAPATSDDAPKAKGSGAAVAVDAGGAAEATTVANPVSRSVGDVVYWLVFLMFLPAVLSSLQLQGLLTPVQDMVSQMLGMLPKVFGAALIGLVGWFVARLVRDILTNLLAATQVDSLVSRAGVSETLKLSSLVGTLAYVLVLVPSVIAALNALQIESISQPATSMLSAFLDAIPHILAALAILFVAWFAAKLGSNLLTTLLTSAGADDIPGKLGLGQAMQGSSRLSLVASRVFFAAVMFFASIEAAQRLQFDQVARLLTGMLEFGGQILAGIVIMAVGFWLARLAEIGLTKATDNQSRTMATAVRFVIVGLVFSMGLRAMGLADDIVNMAFGLTLGAAAVAFALAFGLGGREAAGELMGEWVGRTRRDRGLASSKQAMGKSA